MRTLFILLALLQSLNSFSQHNPGSESLRQDGYYYTNPLLDCETNLIYTPPFKKSLSAYVDEQLSLGKANRISIYFRQLNNGHYFGIKPEQRYNPASLLKVADAIYMMKRAEENPAILKETIEFEGSIGDSRSTTILKTGKTYTIEQLIELMLVHSDNEAKNYLQSYFQNGFMWKEVLADIGIPIKTGAAFPNILSPQAYSRIFRVLYNSSYLNRRSSETILKMLSQTTFKEGIISGIENQESTVANKFGLRNWKDKLQLHESAIVYANSNPYLLTVMTEGTDFNDLLSVLAGTSKLVYDKMLPGKGEDVSASNKDENRLISPLFDCSDKEVGMLTPYRHKVEKKIDNLKKQSKVTDISVYFNHFPSGEGFKIDEDRTFLPASLIKVVMMMCVLKLSEKQPQIMLKKVRIPYTEDISRHRTSLESGKEYTIGELVERLIVFSDNYAAELINKNLPEYGVQLESLFEELGVRRWEIEKNPQRGELSVNQIALLFRVLYNSTYLSRSNSELALDLLSKTSFDVGLRDGLETNIIVANKYGERYAPKGSSGTSQLHDCGIIYFPENPYLLCVMTKGTEIDGLAHAIREVSTLIYEEMKVQFPVDGQARESRFK